MDDFTDTQHSTAGIQTVPIYQPQDQVTQESPTEESIKAFSFEHISEFKITALDYLIKGVLNRKTVAVIYGEPACGKSFFAGDLAKHIITKQPWNNKKVKGGAIVHFALEGRAGAKNRIKTMVIDDTLPYYLYGDFIEILKIKHVQDIIDSIGFQINNASLIIIDTLSQAMNGEDEDNPKMALVVRHASKIAEALNCCVLIVHHGNKGNGDLRGGGALRGNADTVIKIVNNDGFRKATIEKQKDGESGLDFYFKLKSVIIGIDEDDDDITTCVVEYCDASEGAPCAYKMTDKQRLFLQILSEVQNSDGQPLAGIIGSSHSPNLRAVKIDKLKEKLIEREFYGSKRPAQEYDRLKDKFQADGVVQIKGDFIWICRDVF